LSNRDTIHSNGWDEYKKFVVYELERSNERLNNLDRRLGKIEAKLSAMQAKIYMAVIVAASVVTAIAQLVLNSIL
jgi:hypothetical protein